jgi:hypothetical protein
MTSRVIAQGEVSLNGTRYPIARARDGSQRVQSLPVAYPEKTVIGDYTRDSNPELSSITWSDFRGGLGIDIMEGSQTDRYWSGYLWTRHKERVTLPVLATQTDAVGTAAGAGAQRLIDLKGSMYVTFQDSTALRAWKYDGSSAWGSNLHTMPSACNQALNVYMQNKEWAIFACTANWVRFDGTTWEDETDDAWLVAYWDNRLWKITQAGLLSYCHDITLATTPNWTDDAQIPLTNQGQPQSLFTGRNAAREEILYCTTEEGLFAHDAANARWLKVFDWPYYLRAGNEARAWRGRIYIPVGMAVYEYTPGQTAVVRLMGPDRDDGLTSDYFIYTMDSLEGTHNDLLMCGRAGIWSVTAYPSVLAWDGRAWMVLWQDSGKDSGSTTMQSLVASYSHSAHRLWWIHDDRIWYMPLEAGVRNPKQSTTFTYAASSALTALKTPWFHAGQRDIGKLAVRLKVETTGCSANETVTVGYALNYDDSSYTSWAAITSDGVSTLQFPTSGNAVGVAFRAIRFRATLARGGTNTNSPVLVSITLEYDKKLDHKEAYQVLLDLGGSGWEGEYMGSTAAQLRKALQTAKESATLVEFTFRDDSGNTRNFFTRVEAGPSDEETGHREAGYALIRVREK